MLFSQNSPPHPVRKMALLALQEKKEAQSASIYSKFRGRYTEEENKTPTTTESLSTWENLYRNPPLILTGMWIRGR